MKPAPFKYFRPRTRDEALSLLAEHGTDAKPLAGGQSLIPAMNFRLAMPAVLVDLNAISDMAFITAAKGGLRIGAMTRHAAVERSDAVRRSAPLLHEAMPFVAHAAIRTRGTLGGSLAHADPAAELPAVMLALNATIGVESPSGAREIPASDFFLGLFSTALQPGELVNEISIPAPAGDGLRWGCSFQEFSRRHGDFGLAGVAVSIALDARGQCASVRIALIGVADRPMLAAAASQSLVGTAPAPDTIRAAAELAATTEIDPSSDIHASSDYRRHLARVLTRRALDRAFERAKP